jgi:hypothetical protein
VKPVRAAVVLALGLVAAAGRAQTPPTPAEPPGDPAPAQTVAELERTIDHALARFNARDAAGVLRYVSDRYRTGGFTKANLADQLRALYAIHDQVRARIHVDDVRMIGEDAWVYTTGEVVGRLRLVGGTVPVVSWQREPEVARREAGGWRLYGDQL